MTWMSNLLALVRRRKWTCLLLVAAGCFLLLNVIAYNQAYSMTHFVPAGKRTARPEELATWQKAALLFTGITIPRPTSDKTPQAVDLPYEVETIEANGVRLEAWTVPCNEPHGTVVLFHGYVASKASLLAEARAFHDLGFTTCLVDFRGSGGSSGSETTIGVYEADDVAAVVAHCRQQHAGKPLVLFGQSMGSAAILRAVAQHGIQPTAIIIETPFDRMLATVENRFASMGVPAFPFAPLLVFWGGVQHSFNGFTHNPVDYARQVTCPVLFLQGAHDRRVLLAQAEEVFANLAGPKTFELFADAAHEPLLKHRPEQWQRAVARFLTEQCP